jgi:hypothetical protein
LTTTVVVGGGAAREQAEEMTAELHAVNSGGMATVELAPVAPLLFGFAPLGAVASAFFVPLRVLVVV